MSTLESNKNGEIQALNNKINDLNKSIANLRDQLREKEEVINGLRTSEMKLNNQIDSLKRDLNSRDMRIEELNSKV